MSNPTKCNLHYSYRKSLYGAPFPTGLTGRRMSIANIFGKKPVKKRRQLEEPRKEEPKRIGIIAGGFDPVHNGHVRMINDAAQYCDFLIIILHTDEFLKRTKGFCFMDFSARKEIVESIRYIDRVVEAEDDDDTVSKSLRSLFEEYKENLRVFMNGANIYSISNAPEFDTCKELGLDMLFGVGGSGKVNSSLKLVEKAVRHFDREKMKKKEAWSISRSET